MVKEKIIYIGETSSTPLGNTWVAVSEDGLVAVDFQADRQNFIQNVQHLLYPVSARFSLNPEKTNPTLRQIREFLNGERQTFNLPIDWSVLTPFQTKVLCLTYAIPYGKTITYGEIAARLGNPGAARAVGRAEATNPMPVVIPCHRVLGSDGKLHGYGAANGLESKAWLLELEHTN